MEENNWIDLSMILEQRFRQGAKRSDRLETGFSSLDQILGGGLSPGLIILGGIPGVGKSTLALQIAAHVAESGHPVLYFSLEMSASRILAKVISRKFYEAASSFCVTADELLDGALNEEQWKEIEAFKQTPPVKHIVDHLNVCTGSLSASGILKKAQAFSGSGNKTKPLVIIDYLQILHPEKGAQSDKQVVDSSLRYLMQLAHNLYGNSSNQKDIDTGDGLPVILISSLNRTSYKGAIEISSFKETGGIEYSADLLLGLQFQNPDNLNEAMRKSPREVELIVLKNRYGRNGGTVPLQYDPNHDYFSSQTNESVVDAPVTGSKKQNSKEAGGKPSVSDSKAPHDGFGSAPVVNHKEDEVPLKTPPKPFPCVINNTKVANELRKGFVSAPPHDFEVIKGINTICSVSKPLSSFDCCVADAIYTLDQEQKDQELKEFSLLAILQILHGCKRVTLTEQKKEMLKQSIQHLRKVQLRLDCTQHLRSMPSEMCLDSQTGWEYDGPFLAIEDTGENGIYRPALVDDKGILPLYSYGAMARQMITIPSVLLNLKVAKLSNTRDNICLKWFLAHRLEIIRYGERNTKEGSNTKMDRNKFRTISFEPDSNLREEFRLAEPLDSAKAQRLKRLHKSVEQILRYYKRIKYISDYDKDKSKPNTGSFKIIGKINDPWGLNAL